MPTGAASSGSREPQGCDSSASATPKGLKAAAGPAPGWLMHTKHPRTSAPLLGRRVLWRSWCHRDEAPSLDVLLAAQELRTQK